MERGESSLDILPLEVNCDYNQGWGFFSLNLKKCKDNEMKEMQWGSP